MANGALLASDKKEIASELVKGLSAKAAAFDKAVSSAKVLATEAETTAGSLRGKSTGHADVDQALQEVLAGAEKDLQVASESLQTLDKARRRLNDALSAIGVLQGATASLGDPRVAMYCDDLGRTYDLGETVLLQISQQSGAITHAAGVYRVSGATVPTDSLTNANGAFYAAFDGFSKVMAADQPILERHRQLSIEVLAKYDATVSSVSKQFKEVANGSGQSSYLPVLRQMSALLEKGADWVNGLASPMLRAVAGPKPVITVPRLSWRGTSTMGNAVTRMIEQGSYFERGAIDDAKTLAKDGAGQSFSDSLRVVNLAMALHYPIRTLVAPDGMALALGVNGPVVVIRGIGNVERYKLKDGTALLSPPDFTVGGYAIGWDFGGAFQNFCSDVGTVVTGAEQTLNNVGQGVEQFGAQVVKNTAQAANGILQGAETVGNNIVKGAQEVGGEWIKNHLLDYNGQIDWVKTAVTAATYVGYGVAVVATGVAAAPLVATLVAIAIGADAGEAVVDTGKDNWGWDPNTCAGADLALEITKDIAGGLANLQSIVIAAGTLPLWMTIVAGDGTIIGTGGAVTRAFENFESEVDHNPGDQAAIKIGYSVANVEEAVGGVASIVGDSGALASELSYVNEVSVGVDITNLVGTVHDIVTPPSLAPATSTSSAGSVGGSSGTSSGASGQNDGSGSSTSGNSGSTSQNRAGCTQPTPCAAANYAQIAAQVYE